MEELKLRLVRSVWSKFLEAENIKALIESTETIDYRLMLYILGIVIAECMYMYKIKHLIESLMFTIPRWEI